MEKQLQKLQEQIELELNRLEISNNPVSLYEPINYFLSIGGKRIRPILVMLAAELFENKNKNTIYQALAVELFHNFTLIHDDIMDNAPKRRGLPTVHEKWNLSQGILSGDVLLIVAYQYLINSKSQYIHSLMAAFNKMAIEVCEGQQMDMDFENRGDVQIEEYINMIRLKTSVLLGCALEIGAIVSGANEQNRNHLYNFGVNIGIAFQIQDDILDVYGDASKFGKQVGGDIISNKKTFLYLSARKLASTDQQMLFESQKSNNNHQEKVEIIRSIYDDLNVRALAHKKMEDYFSIAMKHLNDVSVPSENKQKLIALSQYLINRES